MKKQFLLNGLALIFLTLFSVSLAAQSSGPRYALVIGNASYSNINKLPNTVNDARDIAAALTKLGYQADLKLDLGEKQFEAAIKSYVAKLKSNRNSEGFFWYAGHGVQINNQNYLLPVDIEPESVERDSFSLDLLLRDFDDARNKVNIIILDACRNNPLPVFSRGAGIRGLAVVQETDIPGDLFMIFSTAPGNVADDGGAGKRNSPFAEAFLKHINSTEAITMMTTDVVRETMALTGGKQRPFSQGSIISEKYYSLNRAAVPYQPVPAGFVRIEGGTFTMGTPSTERFAANEPQHRATVSGFFMGKYEVTVGDFKRFVNATGYKTQAETSGGGHVRTGGDWVQKGDANWKNPYFNQNDNEPVVLVSWNDAIEYCNWMSKNEGLTSAYTVNGTNVTWNRNANGYRLPTEAEWEYACRGGTTTLFSTGNNITTSQANYNGNYHYKNNAKGNYREKTWAVGSGTPNPWGLYDMHGNVYEWCWDLDWYDTDGAYRMIRGGSWVSGADQLRSGCRGNEASSTRSDILGFRLVRQ
jgi:formylglycine-generating enzyme required for sulfatase activity